MLESNFNEEYRRFTNEIVTNNESFFVNSSGNLVFTTPIFTTNSLTYDLNNFAFNNETPENTNLIIDAITLFSTNPNCQNYLPLKIDFGTKPQVEFSDATFDKLSNYKIIVSPPVNLSSIQNRRYDEGPTSFNSRPLRLIDVVESGEIFAFIYQNGNNEDDRQLWLFNSSTKVWSQIPLPFGSLIQSDIRSNPFYIFVWIKEGSNNKYYNIKTGDLELIDSIPNTIAVDYSLQNDIVNLNLLDPAPDLKINLYSRDKIAPTNINWQLTTQYLITNPFNFVPNPAPPLYPEFYISSLTIYNRDKVFMIYESLLRIYELTYKSGPILIASNDTINYEGELQWIFIGGSNINEPYISLFTQVDNGANSLWNWYYITDYSSVVNKKIFDLKPHASFNFDKNANTLNSLNEIKRYRNQVYFYLKKDIYILNLDTGSILTYSLDQLVSSPAFPPLTPNYPLVINFADKNFIIVGERLGYYFGNSRELNDVYRLTFNYFERNFTYQVSGDRFIFNITLPNNANIRDMEIFKFVIDCRVRFTKAKLNINAPTQIEDSPLPLVESVEHCEDECGIKPDDKIISENKDCTGEKCNVTKDKMLCKDGKCKTRDECFKRCVRKTGGVGRVLGYVGEDFVVADFLNLYK